MKTPEEIAAQIWSHPNTSMIEFDARIFHVVAEAIRAERERAEIKWPSRDDVEIEYSNFQALRDFGTPGEKDYRTGHYCGFKAGVLWLREYIERRR